MNGDRARRVRAGMNDDTLPPAPPRRYPRKPDGSRVQVRCHHCGKHGHTARVCPERRAQGHGEHRRPRSR